MWVPSARVCVLEDSCTPENGAAGPGSVKSPGAPKDARQVNLGAAEGAGCCCATEEIVWAKSVEAKKQSELRIRATRIACFIWFPPSSNLTSGDIRWNGTALLDAGQRFKVGRG